MSELSKHLPQLEVLSCKDFAHPWTDSCLLSAGNTLLNSCVGSAEFYAVLYLCQYVSKMMKKKKKWPLKDFLKLYLRSTIFGALVSSGALISHCVLRNLIGRFYYPTFVFLPACIGGCSIFLESRKGQEICFNAFANCAIEFWIKLLEQSKILKWNAKIQTVVFMLLSSLLSSLLGCTNFDLNYFWFFVPPKVSTESATGKCFHKENCWRHILNLFVMYSTTGFVVQFLRFFTKNLKKPKLVLYFLTTPKAYKLAAFLGGYVVLYQAIRCFLFQRNKNYSLIHDSLAGFLAGATFRFQPNITILNSAIMTVVQVLMEVCYRRKMVPDIPYLELLFVLSCGLLFHCRLLMSELCPQLMVYITSVVTHGMSDTAANNLKNILKNLSEKNSR